MPTPINQTRIRADVVERFLRYVRVHTTSDRHSETTPSTQRQFDLSRLLADELAEIGVDDVTVTEYAYVIARLPATEGCSAPPLCLLAHVDTAPDSSGENVTPRIWEQYDGGVLEIGAGRRLDPVEYPELTRHVGDTIITTDGTTLLGADDKAGVAEIMSAIATLMENPDIRHGEIEIVFTPDEEIGRGVDTLNLASLHAQFAYTVDGGREGSIEAECFNAYTVHVEIEGYVIHPGSAKNKMVNAVRLAGEFLSMVPHAESPEATDGRDGFYCPIEVSGDYGRSSIDLIMRDFEISEVERRIAYLRSLAATLERAYPPAKITVNERKQYLNMRDRIQESPFLIELVTEAVRAAGATPTMEPIRGGTDGARLTEMGLPTPNIFAGGHNFHGPYEWIPVGSMVRATETLLHLIGLWAERVGSDAS
jgi:tripeptide aminopeptidase